MSSPTDANGRQRTPTDAPRPLRETVAEAMFESTVLGRPYSWFVAPSTQKTRAIALDPSDLRRMTDAAIAAMVTALLSEAAVEAMTDGVDRLRPEAERDMRAALEAIGAVEGE